MFKTSWKAWKPTVICLVFAFISFLAILQKPAILPYANWIAQTRGRRVPCHGDQFHPMAKEKTIARILEVSTSFGSSVKFVIGLA